MSRTMDDLENDMLALAEAVGVMTIPDPKPRTLWERIDRAADVAYDYVMVLEVRIRREAYVGRHRRPTIGKRIWQSVSSVAAQIDRPLLAALERRQTSRIEEAKARARLRVIRERTDRTKRDISFLHHVINLPLEA